MAVVRVLRTQDRRWRVEIHHDGRVDLLMAGMLILRGTSLEAARRWLAAEGVAPETLVED